MALPQINFNFPHFPPPPPTAKPPTHSIPPPPHSISPPPHSVTPPPPHFIPPPPPPSPDNHTTVIVIVFVSFGGLLFLAFLVAGLCCFTKKKKEKTVRETDMVPAHEHLEVKEAIEPGPHGLQAVVLSITDDIHVDKEFKKNDKFEEAGLHDKSEDNIPIAIEDGASSSMTSSNHHHHLEHKP